MTPEEIKFRGVRAAEAMDDFVGPAIDKLRAEYLAAITKLAANEPWRSDKIVKLSIATRVIDAVEAQFRAAISAGADAGRKIDRAAEIADLPAAKKRWLDFTGGY